MGAEKYDFSGWATRNDLKCSDGRTIRKDAFKDCDGLVVPLVWQHYHDEPDNIIGHALLENRAEGVYTWGKLNDTPNGKKVKELIRNGDVTALSIYANQLKQQSGNVTHGLIREVSVVWAGANPGAYIDHPVLSHADGTTDENFDEGTIYTGLTFSVEPEEAPVEHADAEAETGDEEKSKEKKTVAEEKEKTVKDVLDTFTDEQKDVLYYMIGEALEQAGANDDEDEVEHSDNGGNDFMKHNVFEREEDQYEVISHADVESIFNNAKTRTGSLKAAVSDYAASIEHSITDIDVLFPDYKELNTPPEFVKRNDDWVNVVFNKVHKSPFTRIKTTFANITADEARAKGYIKGHQKIEEVFGLLNRTTDAQTVYKLQKFDRDDLLDITDFDVVAWVKGEMRMMLNEEIARAILISDGRQDGTEYKIKEDKIRPIWKDDDFYTIHRTVDYESAETNYAKSELIIEAVLRARKDYKGSGNPDMFVDPDMLTTMLLAKDTTGRRIYNSVSDLASALRVNNIYEVPIFEGQVRKDKNNNYHGLLAIIVNLVDYNLGANKGGEVTLFDDFDIDYNRYSYLIETRSSGALIKPYSAIAVEFDTTAPSNTTTEG